MSLFSYLVSCRIGFLKDPEDGFTPIRRTLEPLVVQAKADEQVCNDHEDIWSEPPPTGGELRRFPSIKKR